MLCRVDESGFRNWILKEEEPSLWLGESRDPHFSPLWRVISRPRSPMGSLMILVQAGFLWKSRTQEVRGSTFGRKPKHTFRKYEYLFEAHDYYALEEAFRFSH